MFLFKSFLHKTGQATFICCWARALKSAASHGKMLFTALHRGLVLLRCWPWPWCSTGWPGAHVSRPWRLSFLRSQFREVCPSFLSPNTARCISPLPSLDALTFHDLKMMFSYHTLAHCRGKNGTMMGGCEHQCPEDDDSWGEKKSTVWAARGTSPPHLCIQRLLSLLTDVTPVLFPGTER